MLRGGTLNLNLYKALKKICCPYEEMCSYQRIFFFSKKLPHIMGVENFNGGRKYKKTTNFRAILFYLKLQSTFK